MTMVDGDTVKAYISSLYRLLLKREPDEAGFQAWVASFDSAGMAGFENALEGFVRSSEFSWLYYLTRYDSAFEGCGYLDCDSLSDDIINELFEKTSIYWRGTASDPQELYRSVLISDAYRGDLSSGAINDFLATGQHDVDRIGRICDQVGFSFADCKTFLEYGCGVGRLAVNLPSTIRKVNCVDFSAAHLREARENVRRRGLSEAVYSFYEIAAFHDLHKLPRGQDIIHSFIVLQHNTPPVIEKTIRTLLGLLSPGGIAILHLPIAKARYEFNAAKYLRDENSGRFMEMHILPRANLYRLANGSGCKIVYSFCDGGCGEDIYSEIVVYQRLQ